MQESLLNTVKNAQKEQRVNIEELEYILGSSIAQIVTFCKKAHLKPKTDANGSAYFTKEDVTTLKKVKELYAQSSAIQSEKSSQPIVRSTKSENAKLTNDPERKINFLEKAKARVKSDSPVAVKQVSPAVQIANKLQSLENNLIERMGELLSEKMDGFDEIIVELIRTKTENENLRQQVNSLNKQVYILKNELASFTALPFGFYTKKDADSL